MSAERLQEVLQSATASPCPQNGMVQLLSASQAWALPRAWATRLPEGQFLDYAELRVQGELPAGLAERWNVEKRFAR